MKIMKIWIALLILAWTSGYGFGQDEKCKVLKPEIADKYTGDCKKGLASGKGVAEGTEKYEGKFREGLPHGEGTYHYMNGDVYEGDFRNGKRDGTGKFTFQWSGKDSTFMGIWEEDRFVKKILPPAFTVIRVYNVQRYSIQKTGEGQKVTFAYIQNGMNNNTITGLYYAESGGTPFSRGLEQGYENILFPFTCKVSYSTQNELRTATVQVSFEFRINEPGEWLVTLHN